MLKSGHLDERQNIFAEAQQRTNAVCSVEVFGVVSQDLFVDRQGSVLVSLFLRRSSGRRKVSDDLQTISNHANTQEVHPDLFSVPGGLVQRLQPHVAQSQHGVGVVLGGRLLQNTLKLLLTWSPFLLGQVKVSYQGPGVWVILRFEKK